jgi:hypothetical protein
MRALCILFSAWMCLEAGCVIDAGPYYRVRTVPGGLSADDVVRMCKSGVSDEVIIEKIKEEGVAAKPTSEQLASLKKDGVSDAVLGAMLAARVVPEETSVEYYPNYYYGYPYYGYPYYYGYYYPYGYYRPYWGWYYGSYPYYPYHYAPAYTYSVSHYRH